MSDALNELAKQNQTDIDVEMGSINNNIRSAMQNGMTVTEVVDAFKFPQTMETPYQAVAAIALGQHYGSSIKDAFAIYPYLKETNYPNISDKELVKQLFTAKGLPKSTLNEEYYKDKAKKEKAEAEKYGEERTKATTEREHDWTEWDQGMLKSDTSIRNEAIPLNKEKIRQTLDDDWFGKGNQRDEQRERYFDSLFTAESPEEELEAESKYIRNLKVRQQYRINQLKRLEYQLEHNTADETQLERWRIYSKQGFLMARAATSKMNRVFMKFNETLAPTKRSKDVYRKRGNWYAKDVRMALAQAGAPELWRQELNWFDGGTAAVLKNTPTAILTIAAAVIGGAAAGPVGAKAGIVFSMGAAEAGPIFEGAMESGFDEKESYKRANIGFVINGIIEAAGGGLPKYLPSLKKKVFGALVKKGARFGKNMLKELFEELGQEVTSTMLQDSAPYKEDGSFDYDEAVNQFLLLARDTMFMGTAYTAGSKGVGKVGKLINRNRVLAQPDYDDIARIQETLATTKDKPTSDDLTPQSKEISENLNDVINKAGEFYIVDKGKGKYQIWDADTGQQFTVEGKPGKATYDYDTAYQAMDAANAYGRTSRMSSDPMIQLNRYVVSRVNNGVSNPVFDDISTMLNPTSKYQDRVIASHSLKKYVVGLKDKVAKYMGEDRAGIHIPDELVKKISLLPETWEKGREILKQGKPHVGFISAQDKLNITNELRGIIRLHQKYGDTAENQIRRNYINSWILQIKKNKHQKPILSEEDAKTGMMIWLWDMTLGTSKDDHLTTLTKIFGNGSVPLAMKNIQARELSNKIFEDLTLQMMDIEIALDIDKRELHDWSTPLRRKLVKPTEYDVVLGGEAHRLTMGQIMYVNLALRDKGVRETMTTVGVAFPNLDMAPLTEDEIVVLQELLATNEKAAAFVNKMQDFYVIDRGAIINIGSQDMLGYDLVSTESFLPPVHKGDKGQGPVMLMDIFAQTTEDIRTAAHYTGIKPTTEMMLDLVEDTEFKMVGQRSGKNRQMKRYREEMTAMNKSRHPTGEDLTKLITRIGAKRARSILANGRIAMLQAGSYQLYMNETEWRYMRGGSIPKQILEEWDLLRQRAEGMGGVSSVVSVNTIRKMHLGRGSMLDFAMYPLHKVDIMVIKQAATIAYHEMMDKTLTGKARRWWKSMDINPHDLQAMSPEFMQALHSRASYLASTTQPMFFPESRNLYSNSNSAMMRELARFRSFTDQLLRNQSRKLALWKMGEITGREAFIDIGRNMVFATTWYNGLKWVIHEIFRDEDEETRDLLLSVMLGPISNIPFIGWSLTTGIQSLAEDSGFGPAAMSTISAEQIHHTMETGYKFAKAIQRDFSGKPGSTKKADKLYKDAARDAAEDVLILVFGLPVWLTKVVPEEKKAKKKAKPSSSQYRTR